MPPRPKRVPGWKVRAKPEREPVADLILEPLVVPVRLQPLKRVREPEPDLPVRPASLEQEQEPEQAGKLELKAVLLPRGLGLGLDLEALLVPVASKVPALEPRLELVQVAE